MLWSDDVNLAYAFVQHRGKYVDSRIVGSQMDRPKMADHFRDNCPNLRSLSVVDRRSKWIQLFGEKLEKLECWNSSPNEISMYCVNLTELSLNLDDVILNGISFWEIISATLEV